MIGKKHDDEEKRANEQEEQRSEEAQADEFGAEIASMQAELEQLRKDAEESRDHYLRILADFDNFRKRQRDEHARSVSVAREEIIFKLLPIMDNFQRTLQAAEAQHSYETLVEGASLTLRQLTDMLTKEGIEPIDAVGQEFNPELHEAVMRCDPGECEENTVVEEFEKGYVLNGKVLRPARVKVAASE